MRWPHRLTARLRGCGVRANVLPHELENGVYFHFRSRTARRLGRCDALAPIPTNTDKEVAYVLAAFMARHGSVHYAGARSRPDNGKRVPALTGRMRVTEAEPIR